jgi:hypothetical protein
MQPGAQYKVSSKVRQLLLINKTTICSRPRGINSPNSVAKVSTLSQHTLRNMDNRWKLSNMDNRWKHALSTKFLSQLQNKTKQNIFDHSDNDFGLSICKSIKAFLTDLRKKVKGPIKSQLSKATKTVIMACTYKIKVATTNFVKT